MYTIINFRYTQEQGWVAEVRDDPALLSYNIPVRETKLCDIINCQQAVITAACLPFEPLWGTVVDVIDHTPTGFYDDVPAAQIKDGVSSPEWFENIKEELF